MTVQLHSSMQVVPAVAEPIFNTPLAGDSVELTPVGAVQSALFTPAGTLATLTISIDDGLLPGQRLSIVTTQAVTALTLGGTNLSATILALPTSLTANQKVDWVWSATHSYWVRVA